MTMKVRASKGRSGAKKGQRRPSGETRAAGRGRVVPAATKTVATAAPLFGQKKEEEERNKGGFIIFQNLRDLTEKQSFPLI